MDFFPKTTNIAQKSPSVSVIEVFLNGVPSKLLPKNIGKKKYLNLIKDCKTFPQID